MIIPVYNNEQDLPHCLGSVWDQDTRFQIQVIAVDDGSSDRSWNILEENQGPSGARNTGLSLAGGRYLMFLDADDYLLPGCLETALSEAERGGYDMVQMGFKRLVGGRIFPAGISMPEGEIRGYPEMCKIPGYPWMKVFRASVFEKAAFPEGYRFEDSLLHLVVFALCKRAKVLPQSGYVYRHNPSGFSYTKHGRPESLDAYWVIERMTEIRALLGISMDETAYREILLHLSSVLYLRIRKMGAPVWEAAFVLSCGLVEQSRRQLPETIRLSGRLAVLERAFLERDYGLWRRFCLCV